MDTNENRARRQGIYWSYLWLSLGSTAYLYLNLYAPPHIPFLLGLRNPVYVEDVAPGDETRPEDIASTVRLLDEKQVQYILWPARLDFQYEFVGHAKDHVIPLRTYVHSRYAQVQVFPDGDSVWRRNE
jgi:hypothetical protein